jgi:hypothetical protein
MGGYGVIVQQGLDSGMPERSLGPLLPLERRHLPTQPNNLALARGDRLVDDAFTSLLDEPCTSALLASPARRWRFPETWSSLDGLRDLCEIVIEKPGYLLGSLQAGSWREVKPYDNRLGEYLELVSF